MATFDFEVRLTDLADIKFIFCINGVCHNINLSLELTKYSFDVDEVSNHTIEFIMSNKKDSDNILDGQGNFIKNPMVQVKNINLESFNIDQWVYDNNTYILEDNRVEKFCDYMGCNGRVQFTINGPIWQWLLENIS